MISVTPNSLHTLLQENMDEVIDYDELKLNGNSANITFSILQIPILGEVTVDGNIL